jgi:peroxiredoxin
VISTYIQDKSLAVGDEYVDIHGLDINGKPHKLSDFKGKYVLLEFWASWCDPCRQENPNLRKIYTNYKDKGFEILGFSIDNNKTAWKKAIEKDSLSWVNVTDSDGSYSKMAALYNVRAIPANFLINPEGIIVATTVRGGALEQKLKEEIDKMAYSPK